MGKQVRARKEDERLSLRGRFKVVKIRRCCSDRHRPHSLGRGRHYWKENSLKICKSHPGKDLSRAATWDGGLSIGDPLRPWGLGEVLGEFQGVVENLIWNLPTTGSRQHNDDWDFKFKSNFSNWTFAAASGSQELKISRLSRVVHCFCPAIFPGKYKWWLWGVVSCSGQRASNYMDSCE